MYTVLIVDEDDTVRATLRQAVEAAGMAVLEAGSGAQALDCIRNEPVDIMVLDVAVSDTDGFNLCADVCALKNTPILIHTAYGDEFIKLFAYNELGISDYVVKPCSPQEIVARLKVILRHRARRAEKPAADVSGDAYRTGGLVVHRKARTLTVDGRPVTLTPKEFDLLVFLIDHEGHVLTRPHILKEVWGYDFFGSDRTVDTHIKRLRDQLGSYRNCIVTVHRVGYKFTPEHL